jgi:hypothetical protein
MTEKEDLARALLAELSSAAVEGRIDEKGWVAAGPVGSRSMRVYCMYVDGAVAGLFLGMNSANARTSLRTSPVVYEGPEYLVNVYDGGVRVAEGRTRHSSEVLACAQGWLASATLDEVVLRAPFLDAKPRAMRALASHIVSRIGHGLRHEICGDPSYELWVYGEGRSFKVMLRGEALECTFLLGQATVAHGTALDVPEAVAAWLADGVSVGALAHTVRGAVVEPHAEVLEVDPARWHWLHLADRITNPTDVLAPLKGLIELLAASPVARRFFSYSSLDRLCFSASSHYPWVDRGMPIVAPTGHGTVVVGTNGGGSRRELDTAGALEAIEAGLLASNVTPFFGSAPHHEQPLLDECLVRQGSAGRSPSSADFVPGRSPPLRVGSADFVPGRSPPLRVGSADFVPGRSPPLRVGSALRARLVQRGEWYRLVVGADRGRRCEVDSPSVSFFDGARWLHLQFSSLDEAARAILRFCVDGASFDELSAEPEATGGANRVK